MSESDISNDATPEALANAEVAAAAPDTIEAGGAEGPAADSGTDGPSGSDGSVSSGPSRSSSGSEPSMGGDAAMNALTGMSKGETLGAQTLAKKKGALSAGLGAKGASLASLASTPLTGGAALAGLQMIATVVDSAVDKYRVREKGGNVQKAQDWSKGKTSTANPNSYTKNGVTMSASRKRGAPKTDAERTLAAHGRRPHQSAGHKRGDNATGAALKSNTTQASWSNTSKAATFARFRSIQDYGDQGVQKDAKMAPKALGQNGNIHNNKSIRNDTADKLAVTMIAMRPNQNQFNAPRPPGMR